MQAKTVLASLNSALDECFFENEKVLLLGEDVLSPYGGAFKVSGALSFKYPDRVFTTPISEQAITGIAVGLALNSYRPIVEIMFGDFITLSMDQLVNHAAKFPAMFNGKVSVPMVLRTPMGGHRGYGPTHSQSIEKMLLGVPGLTVVAVSQFFDPKMLLKNAVLKDDSPVVFIENKILYPEPVILSNTTDFTHEILGNDLYPIVKIENFDSSSKADIVIITYGGIAKHIPDLIRLLTDDEIKATFLIYSKISDPIITETEKHLEGVKNLLLCSEQSIGFGFSSEIISRLAERGSLPSFVKRYEAKDAIVPASRALERNILPSINGLHSQIMSFFE